MSNFSVGPSYRGRLVVDSNKSFGWRSHRVSFGGWSMRISTDVELDDDTREQLLRALLEVKVQYPSWQHIPAELQPVILKIEEELRDAASEIDRHIRVSAGVLDLPSYRFPTVPPATTPNWHVVHWSFTAEEQEQFAPILAEYDELARGVSRAGATVPLLDRIEGRQVEFEYADVEQVEQGVSSGQVVPPSFVLFGSAWEMFESRSFSAALVILAVAIETVLKWYLSNFGDDDAKRMAEENPSPIPQRLMKAARLNTGLDVAKSYQKWLGELVEIRNHIVHRPEEVEPTTLEMARWFAMGEAILDAVRGATPDQNVGKLVTISEKIDAFPAGTRGVILRRRDWFGDESYQTMLDSGVIRRLAANAFEISKQQEI